MPPPSSIPSTAIVILAAIASADKLAPPSDLVTPSRNGRYALVLLASEGGVTTRAARLQCCPRSGLYAAEAGVPKSPAPIWEMERSAILGSPFVGSDGRHLVSLLEVSSFPRGADAAEPACLSFFENGRLLRRYTASELVPGWRQWPSFSVSFVHYRLFVPGSGFSPDESRFSVTPCRPRGSPSPPSPGEPDGMRASPGPAGSRQAEALQALASALERECPAIGAPLVFDVHTGRRLPK